MPTTVSITGNGNTTEGGSTGSFTVSRDNASGSLSVQLSWSGTANSGDYTANPIFVMLTNGQSSQNVTITAVNDSNSELTETVICTVATSPNYTVGSPSSATINIHDNDTPIAVADSFSGDEGDPITGNVLSNDSDPNSSTMTAALEQDAFFGTVDLNSDGSFEYTPDANFFGTDIFVYRISDGGTGSTTATVTLTVDGVNDAPVIGDQEFTIPENSPDDAIVGIVRASDPDAGQELTYSITVGNGAGVFAIDADTGVISVADSSGLNYEATTAFALTVQVIDNATSALSDTATIDISVTDLPENQQGETQAQRIGLLNGYYDHMQWLLEGGFNAQSEFSYGLNPVEEDGPTGQLLADLAYMEELSLDMQDAILADDQLAFLNALSAYSTALANFNAHQGALYSGAWDVILNGYTAIAYSEGDTLRVNGVWSLLGNLDGYLGQVSTAVAAETERMEDIIAATALLWGGTFPTTTAAVVNLNIASDSLDWLHTGIELSYTIAPAPQDPDNPPQNGVNPGIETVASLNVLAAEIAAIVSSLNILNGTTSIGQAINVANDMYQAGLEMEDHHDDAENPDRTDYYAAKGDYLGGWPNGAGQVGLSKLVGAVDPDNSVYPVDINLDEIADNYGLIGIIFGEVDLLQAQIDEALTALDALATEVGVTDRFRYQSLDMSLDTVQANLTRLRDAIAGDPEAEVEGDPAATLQ